MALAVRTGVASSDIVRSYLGLLAQGKSDFDAIENFRGDSLFKQSLDIGLLPSSAMLLQRMDSAAARLGEFVPSLIETLLGGARPQFGALPCGWLPLDVGVSRWTTATRPKRAWGAPIRGWTATVRWRGWARRATAWSWRCALGCNILRAARSSLSNESCRWAQRLSAAAGGKAPILVRLDVGFDSAQIMGELAACNAASLPRVDWLIKWKPAKTEVATLAALLQADAATCWQHPRAGKRMTVWDEQVRIEGFDRPVRRVMRLTERTIDVKEQLLIEPQLVLEGWTTTAGQQAVRCPGHHHAVQRARHARAIPLGVQDRS